MLVDSLRKLKARDKRIDELDSVQKNTTAENGHLRDQLAAAEVQATQVDELKALVRSLEDRLLGAEERANQRLAAETELLNSQIAELQGRLQGCEQELVAERESVADLQKQLGRREAALVEGQGREEALTARLAQLEGGSSDQLGALQGRMASLQAQLETEREGAAATLQRAEDAARQLEEEVKGVREQRDAVQLQLKDALVGVQADMNKKDRALAAATKRWVYVLWDAMLKRRHEMACQEAWFA
jgi:chromosome segregation ATPase